MFENIQTSQDRLEQGPKESSAFLNTIWSQVIHSVKIIAWKHVNLSKCYPLSPPNCSNVVPSKSVLSASLFLNPYPLATLPTSSNHSLKTPNSIQFAVGILVSRSAFFAFAIVDANRLAIFSGPSRRNNSGSIFHLCLPLRINLVIFIGLLGHSVLWFRLLIVLGTFPKSVNIHR